MRVYGAVPVRCPNGCDVTVSHLAPELVETLARAGIARDHPLTTGYCRSCKTIVRVTWKDVRHSDLPRAA